MAVDGEVHVERVEKIEVAMNGTPLPTTTGVVVLPPPPGNMLVGRGSPTTVSGKAAVAAPDVNELAEEFIRRNRAAFQGQITM